MRSGEEDLEIGNDPRVRFGLLTEDWLANKASEMIGIDVVKDPNCLGWRGGSWICANKDFDVIPTPKYKGRWAMETKTTSSWGIRKQLGLSGSNQTAMGYALQIHHQMLVDKLDGVINPVMVIEDRGMVERAVVWLEGGDDIDEVMKEIPHHIRIFNITESKRTQNEIKQYLTKLREIFLRGDDPPMDGSDNTSKYLRSKYVDRKDEWLVADTQTKVLINDIKKKKEELDFMKKDITEKENTILAQLGDNKGYSDDEGENLMWITKGKTTRVDSARLKEDRPELYEEFLKTSSFNRVHYPKVKGIK